MTWSCAKCSGTNPEGTRFCGHCGSPGPAAGVGPGAASGVAPGPADGVGGRPVTEETDDQDVAEALKSFVSHQVADRLVESGGNLTEERRLVTALFADLSGFTPLADRLDPEQLLEIIDPIIKGLTNVVGKYEGYVDKFAGDALLAFFGAPVAHEDDAARALMVASEMHQTLDEIVQGLPRGVGPLTLHTGVNSGRVIARITGSQVRMDYSVLGDAVILAQRLESAAPAGETYVGEATYMLTRSRFEFEEVGELTLKGKAAPVRAWRLVGPRKDHLSRGDRARSRFIGREDELRTLSTALHHLVSGRGGLISVLGEAGVGKSTLKAQTREIAREKGIQWLEARCLSYGSSLPYRPYADLIRLAAGIETEMSPETALSLLQAFLHAQDLLEEAPYFVRLLGLRATGGSTRPSQLEPEAFRRGLHAAVVRAVTKFAQDAPMILSLEDIHWADTSSLQLTGELARLTARLPVAIHVSGRPESRSMIETLSSENPEVPSTLIELSRLDEAALRTLLADLLGARVDEGVIALVDEKTGGNPFFIEELVLSLKDSGLLDQVGSEWRLTGEVGPEALPATIEGALSARIDALPLPVAGVLQVASVIGRRVRMPLLHNVSDDIGAVEEAVSELVGRGLLDIEPDAELVTFHHALVQDVAYARLLKRRRRELHQRVAEAAERLYGAGDDSIDLLARHLYLGEAGRKAIFYLIRAGKRAKRLFANDEATLHFSRAAEIARQDEDGDEVLVTILIELGELYDTQGMYDQAISAYSEAASLRNEVEAWKGYAAALRKTSRYEAALAVLDNAMSQASRSGDRAQLWLERGWVYSKEARFGEAINALERGLELCGQGERTIAAHIRLQLARAEGATGEVALALQHGQEGLAILEELEDLRGLVTAHRIVGNTQRELGDLDAAAGSLTRALELAERTGNVEESAGSLINLGLVELERGRVHEAIECDRRAIAEFERVGLRSGAAIGYGNLAEKLLESGDVQQAIESCSRSLELARSIGDLETVADATLTRAAILLRQEDFAAASAEACEAGTMFLQMHAGSYAAEAFKLAARAFAATGDEERAQELNSRALSLESEG